MPGPDSIGDLFSPFHGPITAEDIERIEKAVNGLVSALFRSDPEQLEAELQQNLVHKLESLIALTDHIEKNPKHVQYEGFIPELGDQLRYLLNLVNAYYHNLN